MSRILKRPMFRKGGQAMEGVMSLASGGRAKYQEAGKVTIQDLIKSDPYLKEVYDIAQAGFGRDVQQERRDVLSNLLIRGGLGLVAGEGAGRGTLGGIAAAFQKPTEQALSQLSELKRDPAAMLTAQTAIAQKGQERLKLLDLQNQKTDAEKKARVILGADATAEQIQKKASEILEEQIFGVTRRMEEGEKSKRFQEYKEDYGLVGTAADEYDRFMQNRSKIETITNLPVRGPLKGDRTEQGQVDYRRKAKNQPDGIYIDPINGNYIKIINGVPQLIPNPLKKETASLPLPQIQEEVITQDIVPEISPSTA